jgi:two-component system osmolarity sensor histidine kinase EnvZ
MKLRPRRGAPERYVRKFLPRGLFGRSLLIVLLPLMLAAKPWRCRCSTATISRTLAPAGRRAVAGEAGFMIDEITATRTRAR